MVEVFARAAVGDPVATVEMLGAPPEYYLVRDIDAVPRVFLANELLEGA
jgi:hypothetical protein